MEAHVGIDPGYQYIGIAVAGLDAGKPPVLLVCAVIDLKGTGAHGKHLHDMLAERAVKRRLRRTQRAKRRRARTIRALLEIRGYDAQTVTRVVALIGRRGWHPDVGSTSAEKTTLRINFPRKAPSELAWKALAGCELINPGLFHKKREEAIASGMKAAEFDSRIKEIQQVSDNTDGRRMARQQVWHEILPILDGMLDEDAVNEVFSVFHSSSKSHGLDNKRVGRCHEISACSAKRCVGVRYPALWLSLSILQQIPKWADKSRAAYVRAMSQSGLPLASAGRDHRYFRRAGRAGQEQDLAAVKKAWAALVAVGEVGPGSQENVKRLLDDAKRQVRGERPQTRVAFCPEHLRRRVLSLARGSQPPQARSLNEGHSLYTEAICGKLRSFVLTKILPKLPASVPVTAVVIERDAFDLVWNPVQRAAGINGRKGRRPTGEGRRIAPEVRWLGVYGQIASLLVDATEVDCLSWEVGGLCALCGEPLREDVDRAHLIPRVEMGGYPYVGIVAAHHGCNLRMGKSVAKIHPLAVEALEQQILLLEKKHGIVHPWIRQKLGILRKLSTGSEVEEADVRKMLSKVFTTSTAVMQGANRQAKAVADAVERWQETRPKRIEARSAREVARGRWLACLPEGEEEPWFWKAEARAHGDLTNHAMDAFIVACLPKARPVGHRRNRELWGIDDASLKEALPALHSAGDWSRAAGNAWVGAAAGHATPVKSMTIRRVWRQSYARDTQMGDRVYRQGLNKWLGTLDSKTTDKTIRMHVGTIRFDPLRNRAIQAMESASTVADKKTAIKGAIIDFIKESIVAGIDGAANSPTLSSRLARITQLLAWANDESDDIPDWVSIRCRDTWSGGNAGRIRSKQGYLNLESWSQEMRVNAYLPDGTCHEFKLDFESGGLRSTASSRKAPAAIDSSSIEALVYRHRPVVAPFLPEWRHQIGAALATRGYVDAMLYISDPERGIRIPVK